MTDPNQPTEIRIVTVRGERPYPRAVCWSREAAQAVAAQAAEVLPGVVCRVRRIAGVE